MNDDLFKGFQPPDPPPGLREAALGAGRAAFADAARAPAPAADIWTRLYRSRTLRLAWAASVVLLAAAHVTLPRHPSAVPSSTAWAPGLDPEVSAIARLPRISEQAVQVGSGERS